MGEADLFGLILEHAECCDECFAMQRAKLESEQGTKGGDVTYRYEDEDGAGQP